MASYRADYGEEARFRWWQRLRAGVGLFFVIVLFGGRADHAGGTVLRRRHYRVGNAGVKEAREDPQEVSRRDVVVAGHIGDVNTARAAKSDQDPRVRASALGALDRMGALADEELRDALRDPSPRVRMRVAALTVGRPGVSPTSLLDDPSDDVVGDRRMGLR